jgi:5-methylcytosine-specific restriction endonuclease McrA
MAAAVDGLKLCPKCARTLSVAEFGKDRKRSDGLKVWCKECHNAGTRAHYRRDPQKKLAANKEWFAAHPDETRAYVRAYQKRNPEKTIANFKQWRAKNPDTVLTWAKNCYAKRKGAEGSYKRADVLELYAEQEGLCPYCRVALSDTYHVDHIMPLARGGTNYRSNIQLTCATCNLRKHAKDPAEFAASLAAGK